MASQSMIWTALPNGLVDRQPRLSVLLSPRLDPGGDAHQLGSFPEWLDWPATLQQATFTIHYGSDSLVIDANQVAGDARIDDRLGRPDSNLWRGLLPANQFVRPHQFQDFSAHRVVSYDTDAIAALVDTLYGKLAATGQETLPEIATLLADPDWRALVDAVGAIDSATFDRELGAKDPARLFDDDFKLDPDLSLAKPLADFMRFHTPPARPRVETHARTDDPRVVAKWQGYEYQRETAQQRSVRAQTAVDAIDFHQVIAAMNQYPTLLRRLGLVIDIALPRKGLRSSTDDALWVEANFPDGILSTPTRPSVSPLTHTELDRDTFQAVPDPLPPGDALRVRDGLIDLQASGLDLRQVDVDSAGAKLIGFARSLAQQAADLRRVDPVSRREKCVGVPSLRNVGLMLTQRARSTALSQRFVTNQNQNVQAQAIFSTPANAQNLPPPPELYAEDLVRGIRYDIWDGTANRWNSLFRRGARYTSPGGTIKIEEEEATARLATTKAVDPAAHPDTFWLHEAVVSWTGWSLGAPPPGRAILPDDSVDPATQTEAEVPAGIPLQTQFNVLPKSLPRLRYGRNYWIRGRVVDLAGNSLAPQTEDFGNEQPTQHQRPYLRYEPIEAPILALREDGAATIDQPEEGESMARLAIRSFNDLPAQNTVPTTDEAFRVAVPPQASVRAAEQHGLLDHGGRMDPTTFNLLATQDRDAKQPGAAPREEVLALSGPLDPVPVDTVYAVYPDNHPLTYLPDPLAVAVAARIRFHRGIDETTIISIPLYPNDSWPHARPFHIRAYENAADTPHYDPVAHTLQIPLAKAERAQVQLSMQVPEEALSSLGVWQMLSDQHKANLQPAILNGQHWMLTPWRKLAVVHAVQRPLIAPAIIKHLVQRSFRGTSARVPLLATCSLASTDRLDLLARWHEPDDDVKKADAELIAQNRVRTDTAFTVKVTTPRDYDTVLDGHTLGGTPDHTIPEQDMVGVGLPGNDFVPGKHHEFNDTRYRRIEYQLAATTRFREYLPHALLTAPTADGEEPTEKHIQVVGKPLITWIPNSAPPAPPSVLYVVPTFGWTRTEDDGGNLRRWRRGGGLRVYLDRPWQLSGYGEMLAVVLPPTGFSGDPDNAPAGQPLKNTVTQWGNDPIWQSGFVDGIAPAPEDFLLQRREPDPSGKWLPTNAPASEADQSPGTFRISGLQPPALANSGTVGLNIAPHDVFYDDARRLWYCDIEIAASTAYNPFIRLALARYQPTSLNGAHLSDVVLVDFMALTPDRWLNVNRAGGANTRTVTLFGTTYTNSSGAEEAAAAPAMSLFNTVTGQSRTLTPAEVARRTVVEAWLEKLDPARGEDFGWQRVGGMIGDTPQLGPVDPLRQFVPVAQRRRAVALTQARQFDVLLAENLATKLLYGAPLWSGEIGLPNNSDGARFRLVVAEYEEYLTDDDRPYDPVPETKGRRLVFVEHVELS